MDEHGLDGYTNSDRHIDEHLHTFSVAYLDGYPESDPYANFNANFYAYPARTVGAS